MEYVTGQSRFAVMVIHVGTKTRAGWLLVAVLSIAATAAPKKSVEFPGPQAQLKSPHGRYVVENVDSDKEPHHTLLLRSGETGSVRILCTYKRHVNVLWSPDGNKLAVNDYSGSDFSKSLIFSADGNTPPQDVGAELLQSLKGSPEGKSLADNH